MLNGRAWNEPWDYRICLRRGGVGRLNRPGRLAPVN